MSGGIQKFEMARLNESLNCLFYVIFILLYSISFRRVCRVISISQNKSDDLSSSREMSARFQSICQRANAISEKLFYNFSSLNRPNRLTQCCTQFKPFGNKTFCFNISISFKCECHLLMQMQHTKNFNPTRFELGTTPS